MLHFCLAVRSFSDSLLAEEIREGWVREVPGGVAALRDQYAHCAVGKLGLVQTPGRAPRLVVDSSVSAVTENTTLPNRSCNPTLSYLRRCLPLSPAQEDLAALVLDVSKAHRRIKIRPEDQGLPCFHRREKLYHCLTLNFGARASSYYWSRAAGLLCRLLHRILFVNHALLIYVDDLLSLLRKSTSPLLAAIIVILLLALQVPMSWHKACLSSQPVWIGWHIDLLTGTVQMESAKQQRLLLLLQHVLESRHVSRHDVEKLTGKLLWLSGLLSFLRPTLAPLSALQHAGQTVMAALTMDEWSALRSLLDADLMGSFGLSRPCFLWRTRHCMLFSDMTTRLRRLLPGKVCPWPKVDLQRRTCVSVHIEHVLGFLNDIADSLSRSGDPRLVGFDDAHRVSPPWRELLVPLRPQSAPLEAEFAAFVPALLWVALWGGSRSVSLWTYAHPILSGCGAPCTGSRTQPALSAVQPDLNSDFQPLVKREQHCVHRAPPNK